MPHDGLAKGREPVRRLGIHRTQLPINPAHEIVIGNVPHEQEQAVRHLVEVAVAQRVAGQGASIEVPGLGTRSGPVVRRSSGGLVGGTGGCQRAVSESDAAAPTSPWKKLPRCSTSPVNAVKATSSAGRPWLKAINAMSRAPRLAAATADRAGATRGQSRRARGASEHAAHVVILKGLFDQGAGKAAVPR